VHITAVLLVMPDINTGIPLSGIMRPKQREAVFRRNVLHADMGRLSDGLLHCRHWRMTELADSTEALGRL